MIVLCAIYINADAQKLTYKIFLNKDMIGTLVATRDIQTDHVNYVMQSSMTVHKIINVDVEYSLKSSFSHGKLIQSTAYQKINKKIQTNTLTQWDGAQYNIKTKDDNLVIKNKVINNNMCSIYYYEPIGISQVYSDAFGKFLPVKPVAAHRYEVVLPDGKKNYYNYSSGICYLVETDQLFSKIIFRLTR